MGGLRILPGSELESVESAAGQQKQPILTHAVADGAQLAAEAKPLAQQPCLGVTAAFAGVGKLDLDETEQHQPGGEILDGVRGSESYSESVAMTAPALGLGAQRRDRNYQRGLCGRLRRELMPPQDAAHRRSP